MAMMVMMIVGTDCFQFGWRAASVSGLAPSGFELNSCMCDLESVAQGAVNTV
jgi:hypothetical protein